jgi:hypothetical protein
VVFLNLSRHTSAGILPGLGQDRFQTNQFPFVIDLSSHHSMLCSLRYSVLQQTQKLTFEILETVQAKIILCIRLHGKIKLWHPNRGSWGSAFMSVPFPVGSRFLLLLVVQIGSGVPPASKGCGGGGCVKLSTYLQLMPRSKKRGSRHPLHISLHGIVLNYLSTGTTLSLFYHHRRTAI